jgi:nitroimidazol reductase NimA-like FMN-containing flavoprotein (pyridoxamine 5'-phosphate oxidase superfamily)
MIRTMDVDRNGLEVLTRLECLELVRRATIGRLAIHSGALPTIVPVNFVLTDEGVVIRTAPGSKLDNAVEQAVVAFEVDEIDPLRHTGWSVVITGLAREITDPAELDAVRRLPLAHWAPGPATRYMCVPLDLVSGRRLSPVAVAG